MPVGAFSADAFDSAAFDVDIPVVNPWTEKPKQAETWTERPTSTETWTEVS